jgi:hypothetical protein
LACHPIRWSPEFYARRAFERVVAALEAIDPERVLPLHFAERLSQAQIGALNVGAWRIVAISAGASGGMRTPLAG